MKRTTKKLSGIGLELFMRRFYGSYSGVDEALARRLSEDSAKTFASVRVRRTAWRDWRPSRNSAATAPKPETPSAQSERAPARTQPKAARPKSVLPKPTPSPPPAEAADTPFDPYAIGLVPTYQREGANGLDAKLAAITSLDNLRKMARSQQVALPAELRGKDANIDAVRAAIVSAVGKRIANRRAAAG